MGCAVALIGAGAAGTVAFVRGDLESTEPYDVAKVYKAAQEALRSLGLARISQTRDVLGAKIVTRDAFDKKITIKIKYVTEYSSQINIRVAIFGDEEKSRKIFLEILEFLRAE
jgi:hypothetical protein